MGSSQGRGGDFIDRNEVGLVRWLFPSGLLLSVACVVCWLVLVMATSNQAHSTLLRVWPISPQHAPGVCTSSNPPHVHPSMACQQSSSTTALLDQGDVHAPRSRGDHLGFQLVFLMLALLLLLPALLVYTGTGTEHRHARGCGEPDGVVNHAPQNRGPW